MTRLLYKYKNGNYFVEIYEDGTKIRYGDVDKFIPEFPESIDLKITNYCESNCPYCHENSNTTGRHANLKDFYKLVKEDYSGIEIAIGGGNILSHPDLIRFLTNLNEHNIIPNITISQ